MSLMKRSLAEFIGTFWLASIPVTNTSVNPARSTGPALVLALSGEGKALGQLWLFWVAPIVGAALAGVVYRFFEHDAP